jgi:hypothetical protein
MNTKGTAGTTGTAGARPHWRCLPAMAGETARAGMSHAPPPLRPSAVFFASPFRVFRVFRGSRPSAPICVICGYILRLFLSWFSWRLGGSILSLCASLWLIQATGAARTARMRRAPHPTANVTTTPNKPARPPADQALRMPGKI